MKRNGFTMVEMIIALSISAIMMVAFGGMLTSVWMMAKESTDELDCALHMCAVRQKLFHRLTDKDGNLLSAGGLVNATDISCCAGEGDTAINASFGDGSSWSVKLTDAAAVRYFGLDASKRRASDYRQSAGAGRTGVPPALQYVYLAVPGRSGTTYYDRMIVPIYGRWPDLNEFKDAIGGEW